MLQQSKFGDSVFSKVHIAKTTVFFYKGLRTDEGRRI